VTYPVQANAWPIAHSASPVPSFWKKEAKA